MKVTYMKSAATCGAMLFVSWMGCTTHEAINDRQMSPVQKPGAGTQGVAPTATGNAEEQRALKIISDTCSGSSCHGPTKGTPVYVNQLAKIIGDAAVIAARLTKGDMPSPGLGKTIAEADKTFLLQWLKANGGGGASGDPTISNNGTATGNVTPGSNRPSQCPAATIVAVPTTPLTFAGDINPVLANSCAGGTCHSAGAQQRQIFVGDEAKFRANADGILIHFKNGTMPIGGKILSAEGKVKIIQALCLP